LPSRIVAIEAHAAIAGDAAIHLVPEKRPEILIAEGALGEAVAAVDVSGHDRHILEVALAPFLADRAIVGMIGHQPFDDGAAHLGRLRFRDRDPGAVLRRGHAGHDDLALSVVLVPVLRHRALATGAHRAERRVPAEVGQIDTECQTGCEQILVLVDRVLPSVDEKTSHSNPRRRCGSACRLRDRDSDPPGCDARSLRGNT
jgi:hypothetical protein